MALAGTALLALASAGCGPIVRGKLGRDEVLQNILPSAVQVIVEQQEGRRIRSGSGVAIAQRGASCFVLTSGHTIADLKGKVSISAVFGRSRGPGARVPAHLLADRDDAFDLALLETESDQCAPVEPGPAPALGEPVWVIGFPQGRHIMLSSGIVSQLGFASETGTDSRFIVDAPVSYGVSGGGVYDARTGGLLGLVEGFSTARIKAQGISPVWYIDVPLPGQTIVTPLADIRRFLAQAARADLLAPP